MAIGDQATRTGRLYREDGSVVNEADLMAGLGLHVQDYRLAIARGEITGAEPFVGFGQKTTSGAETNAIIWPDGALYIPAPAGVQPSIVSTSANDTAAGTGIQQVEVHYLDANLAPQTTQVTLAGLTPVNLTPTDVRFIQCTHAVATGSGKAAAGIITVSYSGNTLSLINTGDLRCRSSARMVPAGKRAFVASMVGGMVSGTAAANGHIDFVATELDGGQYTSQGLFFGLGEVAVQDNSTSLDLSMPAGPFRAGTVLAMAGTVDKAATLTGTWFGWLENVPA